MAYCRDCGRSIGNSRGYYCRSCEQDIVNDANACVDRASDREYQRIRNGRSYAHSWLQSLIGWIIDLMVILGKWTSGGCYITSAVVDFKGMPDDSRLMQILRDFRYSYILNSGIDERFSALERYYLIGQEICRWIHSRADSRHILEYVSRYVLDTANWIEAGQYDEAYRFFESRTIGLRRDVFLLHHLET